MRSSNKMKFIVSDQKHPKVTLKPGQTLKVVSVSFHDETLTKRQKIGARLCGGTDTCISLVDVDP
jgi:hypothetical protein